MSEQKKPLVDLLAEGLRQGGKVVVGDKLCDPGNGESVAAFQEQHHQAAHVTAAPAQPANPTGAEKARKKE